MGTAPLSHEVEAGAVGGFSWASGSAACSASGSDCLAGRFLLLPVAHSFCYGPFLLIWLYEACLVNGLVAVEV